MSRRMKTCGAVVMMSITWAWTGDRLARAEQESLRAGAASVDLVADDAMVIGGSIGPGRVKGQEGKLRAAAVVIQGPPDQTRLALVACDVLMVERDILDAACRQIEQRTGIPSSFTSVHTSTTVQPVAN
ncbi:MAG: hypothetical protein HYV60_20425 [Planctomycetia bacterium]|nr:hypothetical protein [Planctomycetia bacterium]